MWNYYEKNFNYPSKSGIYFFELQAIDYPEVNIKIIVKYFFNKKTFDIFTSSNNVTQSKAERSNIKLCTTL